MNITKSPYAFLGDKFLDWLIGHNVIPDDTRRVVIDMHASGGVTIYTESASTEAQIKITPDIGSLIANDQCRRILSDSFSEWVALLTRGCDPNICSTITIDAAVAKPVAVHLKLFADVAAIKDNPKPEPDLLGAQKVHMSGAKRDVWSGSDGFRANKDESGEVITRGYASGEFKKVEKF